MLSEDQVGGRTIGPELREALRRMHDELGVETVRAHAILCDDLGVYREVDGEPVHDFSGVDRVYDTLLELGLRPVVELSYMPHDLAADPTKTVFAYDGDHLAAAGLGPLGRPGHRPDRAPGRPLRAGRGARPVELRGLERGEPRRLLERLGGGVPPAVRRHGRRRAQGRRAARRRRTELGRGAVGRVAAGARGGVRARRSTSCRRTPTAARRWTCGRSWPGTVVRTRRSGGPSGVPARSTSTWSGDSVFAATFLLDGMALAAWAGSRRSRTGWPRTTSRSSAGRRSWGTAASAC